MLSYPKTSRTGKIVDVWERNLKTIAGNKRTFWSIVKYLKKGEWKQTNKYKKHTQ